MKITYKEDVNVKTFEEVKIGEVFALGNRYFMKTFGGMETYGASFNAIYLDDGHLADIDPYEKVTLIKYEFNVMV